jgi:ribose 5-phosphate isomerase B
MRVVMAADPGGQDFLDGLRLYVEALDSQVQHIEAAPLNTTDWPTAVHQVGLLVAAHAADRGILVGPTGNGEALMINRVPEVRCAVCWDSRSALVARRELDCNVLAIGRELIPFDRAKRIVQTWLRRSFKPRSHHEPAHLDHRHPDRIALGSPNGRGRHLSPFFEEPVYICEHCRAEFAFDVDLFDGASQDLIQECPVCGQENRILVEIDSDGDIRAWGDPDVSH